MAEEEKQTLLTELKPRRRKPPKKEQAAKILKKIKNMEKSCSMGRKPWKRPEVRARPPQTKSELEEKRIMQMRLEQELKAKDEERSTWNRDTQSIG